LDSLDDYRWLVSDAAAPWLEKVRADLSGESLGPALVTRLRKDLSAARAHLVVEQVELRARAHEKFTHAQRMFFTRKGLEQATDEQLAAMKAARFPAGQKLADLCCGIGGDLLALAPRSSQAVGVDLDPAVALLAQANLRAYEYQHCEVHSTDASMFPVADVAAWHIDPDRRARSSRTTQVEFYDPPVDTLDRLLAANPNAAIKLAPAADVPLHWRDTAERCWFGSRGECRQQVAWFGTLAQHPGRHTAIVVDARGGEATIVGAPDESIPVSDKLGRYLYEPHAAVLAAKLTGVLCRESGLAAVSPEVAYLTSPAREALPGTDFPLSTKLTGNDSRPLLAAFEIVDVLPLDLKQLKTYCRAHCVGTLEVKKRGVDVDPVRLQKQLNGSGGVAATLIVTPIAGRVRAIIARRLIPPPSADPGS
jgi:hypothetical protein